MNSLRFWTDCPVCEEETEDINNFYCVKNRGKCENCLVFDRVSKQKEKDLFRRYRPRQYIHKPNVIPDFHSKKAQSFA